MKEGSAMRIDGQHSKGERSMKMRVNHRLAYAAIVLLGASALEAPICLFNKGSAPVWFDELAVVLAPEKAVK